MLHGSNTHVFDSQTLLQDPLGCYGNYDICPVLSQVALVVKNPPVNAGEVRDAGSIPGSGISPGKGNGNPLQYSCLENPMDRGAW